MDICNYIAKNNQNKQKTTCINKKRKGKEKKGKKRKRKRKKMREKERRDNVTILFPHLCFKVVS